MQVTTQPTLRCLHYHHTIDLEEGGVVRAVIDMLDRLSLAGVQVTLVTHNAKDCPKSWQSEARVKVVTLPGTRAGGLIVPGELRRSVSHLVAEHDVVHLHTPWAPAHRAFVNAAVNSKKPYLVTLHGMLDDWCMTQSALKKRVYLSLWGRKLLQGAAYVQCTAAAEAEQSHRWYPGGRPYVLPYVVDLSPYDPQPTPDRARAAHAYLGKEGIKLLFLSRIHPKKGLEHLIRACGELERRGVRFELGIAGPGEDAYVQSMKGLAEQERVADRCHFLGMVRGEDKLSLYSASDLFVLPTSQENFGLVFPESLLCGTPVITTKGVDIWRELQEAGGVIVEPATQQLADAIQALSRLSWAEMAGLGQRGRSYVKQWLDPGRTIEQYMSVYRDAVDRATS